MNSSITSDLTTKVAILEKESSGIINLLARNTEQLEKLAEVAAGIKEIVTVHEHRLLNQENTDRTLFEALERRKEEYSRGVERLHERIDQSIESLANRLKEDRDNRDERLLTQISALHNKIDEMKRNADSHEEEREEKDGKIEMRIEKLERWRWMMVGAGVVLGFVFSTLKAPILAVLGIGS